MFVETAYAMAGAPAQGQPSPMGPIFMVGIMFAIMYFMMIRPQQKKLKEHEEFVAGLNRGDDVVTDSGMLGTIVAMTDTVVTLEVADGVKLKFERRRVAARRGEKESE